MFSVSVAAFVVFDVDDVDVIVGAVTFIVVAPTVSVEAVRPSVPVELPTLVLLPAVLFSVSVAALIVFDVDDVDVIVGAVTFIVVAPTVNVDAVRPSVPVELPTLVLLPAVLFSVSVAAFVVFDVDDVDVIVGAVTFIVVAPTVSVVPAVIPTVLADCALIAPALLLPIVVVPLPSVLIPTLPSLLIESIFCVAVLNVSVPLDPTRT